jgi:molybdopterin/thiamine biosynthesis adenylyltransferase
MKDTCLTALADKSTLQAINDGLVERQRQSRKAKTKKFYGQARVLTVEEMRKKSKERDRAEQEAMQEKERRLALKGKVGFAKLVWKELHMDTDLFNSD